jgi:hypothetical protein
MLRDDCWNELHVQVTKDQLQWFPNIEHSGQVVSEVGPGILCSGRVKPLEPLV